MKKIILIIAASFLTYPFALSAFDGFEKEHRKLPPENRRIVIGAWVETTMNCTRSIEQVNKDYFDVLRCGDKSDGLYGIRLYKKGANIYRHSPDFSDNSYTVLSNGDLRIRYGDGSTEDLPAKQKHVSLNSEKEGSLTQGLNCREVGFRYGHTATKSMSGKPFNPKWDFAVPARCRDTKELAVGIKDGIAAAK